jgi:hypothetical protein
MQIFITLNAINARRGIVINPKYSTYLVVQETPVAQGIMLSFIIL